jgi:hypothetical protein
MREIGSLLDITSMIGALVTSARLAVHQNRRRHMLMHLYSFSVSRRPSFSLIYSSPSRAAAQRPVPNRGVEPRRRTHARARAAVQHIS